jgi:hypothetical protein
MRSVTAEVQIHPTGRPCAAASSPWAQSALSGVNAGVVGLLVAALIGLASTAIASLR